MYDETSSYVQVDRDEIKAMAQVAADNYESFMMSRLQDLLIRKRDQFNKNRLRWWRVFNRKEWSLEDVRKYLIENLDYSYLHYNCYKGDDAWELFDRTILAADGGVGISLTFQDYETIRTWFQHKPRKVENVNE
jgi:hypothetical protein